MGNDGKQRYSTKYYNLDVILAVGYRVNSRNATFFRRWATNVLKEYLLRGYVINQRLFASEFSKLLLWDYLIFFLAPMRAQPSNGVPEN